MGYVGRSEWRWVVFVSLALLLLGFLPFILLAFAQTQGQEWAFMGVIHDFNESATLLARMKQGEDGQWLTHFLFTPEQHLSALVHPLYVLLGQLSRVTVNSLPMVFHIMRLLATITMYLAIYQLGATIWTRLRTRRIFFVLASISGGLGWIVAILTGEIITPDLASPQVMPFYASLVNVHYPVAITFMVLLVSVFIGVLRPDEGQDPTVQNGGAVVVFCAVGLAFVFPQATLPLVLAFFVCVLLLWQKARKITPSETRWLVWFIVPILPILTYYILTLMSNSFVVQWIQQQNTPTAPLFYFLLGLGIPLVLALPSLWRAARRFEADGDRFMLLWLLAMLLCYVLPVPIHEQFIMGLMIPLAYFGTRALEDVWFRFISRPNRRWLFVIGVPVLMLSPLLALFVPILPAMSQNINSNIVLETEYVATFNWLDTVAEPNNVIVASPDVAIWIPSQVGARVVYGHPSETMFPNTQKDIVNRWYTTSDELACSALRGVQPTKLGAYWVDFMILGPRERAIGAGDCAKDLTRIATFGRVDVYYCDIRCKLERLVELP